MATRTQLIIEQNLVTKVTIEEGKNYDGSYRRETMHGTVELNSLLDTLLDQRGKEVFMPRLAEGQVIALKSKGQRQVVIVELPPAVRRIIETIGQSEARARQCAFPWVYLVVYFCRGAVDRLFVFYRNQPAEGLEADLSLPNLPNIYGQGSGYKVCTGSMSGCETNWPIEKKLDWLIQTFWDSQFNTDLAGEHWVPSLRLAGHPQLFADWEAKSRQDPRFILGIQWRPANLTLQQVLDKGVA